MSNFLFTVNAVVPLFVLVGLGYWMRQKQFLDEKFVTIFNRFAFQLAIPCSLFKTAYKSDIKSNFNPDLILINLVLIATILVTLLIIVPRAVKKPQRAAVVIQGIYRTNIVLFGLSLSNNLFGAEGSASMAIVIATSVPLYNIIAVVLLSIMGNGSSEGLDIKCVCKSIVTNNLIIATVLGLLFSYFDVVLPPLISVPVTDLAACATPLAMISLGGQFSFKSACANLKLNIITTVMRLVVVPAIVMPIVILLGFRGSDLGALFINFAAPTATSSFIMAKNMGCDGDLAGEVVVFTTLFAAFTVFLGVFILKSFALI